MAAIVVAALIGLLALLSRLRVAGAAWDWVAGHLALTALGGLAVLVAVALLVFWRGVSAADSFRTRESRDLSSPTNLLADSSMSWVGPITSTTTPWVTNAPNPPDVPEAASGMTLRPREAMTSSVTLASPGSTYVYSMRAGGLGGSSGRVQLQVLWLGRPLTVTTWTDLPAWDLRDLPISDASSFHTGSFTAPDAAYAFRLVVKNVGEFPVTVGSAKVSDGGVYVERRPNGARASIAFSFDWESAMGGAIHSKGMAVHDPAAAAQHGMQMREGADWLNALFTKNGVHATFYATGYNLLDGNTERRTFSGNPTYKWASPKNRWASDYWLTHPWYSDDPFGTYQTQPAWYFGDQTRALLQAGHEIAPHTFGHLYVRGSNPDELSTDMDEWVSNARPLGILTPTTFAFPWRSSNSLTADFYDVLYRRGIRTVTRVYERDLPDLYTLSAPKVYPRMEVMPDFLLGTASVNAGEEATGAGISLDEGIRTIEQAIARRGTTSFWQHPEQLASQPELKSVRDTWEGVVAYAAQARDRGELWIATVADISAYEDGVAKVSTRLEQGFLGFGGWTLVVRNDSGRELQGVTLTLPGDAVSAYSSSTEVATVYHPESSTTRVSAPGRPFFPARQLVLRTLPQGETRINIEWAGGQEPVK